MKRFAIALVGITAVALVLLAEPRSLFAQPVTVEQSTRSMTPEAALERLLTVEPIQADWFAPNFLAQVPIAQVQSILTSLKTELGAFQRVQRAGTDYELVFEKGVVPTKLGLNGSGQFAGLLFQPPRLNLSRLSDAVAGFKALPGKVSLLVREGQSERAALNPTQPLAVGSTFKLAVLEALRLQIEAKQRSWGEVVALRSEGKSLPSGFLQTWADGSLLTVQSLAALMISQSDNTATDHLIRLVGSEAIERLTPRNRPFLTTREFFALKARRNADLLRRYRSGDEATRRSLLGEVATAPLPDVQEFAADPVATDIEWFFTAQELCNLIDRVKDLPLMSINPGVAQSEDWSRVAFKGGSEPGVLNLTTWLQAKNGKQYCVSATWNQDAAIDETRFTALYASTLNLLK